MDLDLDAAFVWIETARFAMDGVPEAEGSGDVFLLLVAGGPVGAGLNVLPLAATTASLAVFALDFTMSGLGFGIFAVACLDFAG